MTNVTTEEVHDFIRFTDRLMERAESDPALVDTLLASIEERPKPHPLSPKERYEKLIREAEEERKQNGSSGE